MLPRNSFLCGIFSLDTVYACIQAKRAAVASQRGTQNLNDLKVEGEDELSLPCLVLLHQEQPSQHAYNLGTPKSQ